MSITDITQYKLPREGTTLPSHITRCMCKTEWLTPVSGLIAQGKTADAPMRFGLYPAAAPASFAQAYYQPRFNERHSLVKLIWQNDKAAKLLLNLKRPHPKVLPS